MDAFVRAIPEAAKSPLALVAYGVAAILFVVAGNRGRTLKMLLSRLNAIPASQRKEALIQIIGEPLPASVSAEQYIRLKRMQMIFLLSAGVLLAAFVVIALAALRPAQSASPVSSGRYDCMGGNSALLNCLVTSRAQGGPRLNFDGPTHEAGVLTDQYDGEIQCATSQTCRVVLTNRFDPQPAAVGKDARSELSTIDISAEGPKRWAGVWTFNSGEHRNFAMSWKGSL